MRVCKTFSEKSENYVGKRERKDDSKEPLSMPE
jgi:hypothetical protein